MSDTQTYCVYENQRWNPLSGYTSTGLPTDRYMWSDITGKHKRTREHTKLLSRHWHWVKLYAIYLKKMLLTNLLFFIYLFDRHLCTTNLFYL